MKTWEICYADEQKSMKNRMEKLWLKNQLKKKGKNGEKKLWKNCEKTVKYV